PGAGRPAGGGLRRRADRQPRLPVERGAAGIPASLGRGAGPDDRDGDPRPGGRRPGRRGGVPGRRPGGRPHGRPDPPAGARPPQGAGGLSRMWRYTLTGLRAARGRLLLTAVAVALGVGAVSGTLVITD